MSSTKENSLDAPTLDGIPEPDPIWMSPPPMLLEGRYSVGLPLGRGAAGRVFRGRDTESGKPVAIKLLRAHSQRLAARARREVAALRALRVPGVVSLLDSGMEGDTPVIVMELLGGKPFPGRAMPCAWSEIAETVFGLLETLARVHELGVTHRDLKPSNVFVDDAGRATILDFGLARGQAIGHTITATGALVGTPRYWAPEQILGRRANLRTDLYAVGVMAFEALTGAVPGGTKPGDDVMKRVHQPAPRVSELAPDVPWRVARAVDRLLEREPADRFGSAAEAMQALQADDGARSVGRALPWLGERAPIEGMVSAIRRGETARVVGEAGTGRTRVLREAAQTLESDGWKPVWVLPGTEPLASLERLVGDPANLSGETLAEVTSGAAGAVRAAIEARSLVLADDEPQLDRWSREVLAACADAGGVLFANTGMSSADVYLEPLTEAQLVPLFDDGDATEQLAGDAARELYVRTRGIPARVDTEVGAWVRAGVADWRDGLLLVEREALDGLAAGMRVAESRHFGATRALRLTEEQEQLLAWIQLAGRDAGETLLAQVLDLPRWRFEAQLQALFDAGAIERGEGGRLTPLTASQALSRWSSERIAMAHDSIADSLPEDAPRRVLHRVLAGAADRVADEAVAVVRTLEQEGQIGEALSVIEPALALVSEVADDAAVRRLESVKRHLKGLT